MTNSIDLVTDEAGDTHVLQHTVVPLSRLRMIALTRIRLRHEALLSVWR